MAKQVDISLDSFKQLGDQISQWFNSVLAWLTDFFNTIDTYESIAVGVIVLGLVLVIVGLVIL